MSKMTLEQLKEHLRAITVSHGFTTNYDAWNESRKALAHEILGMLSHISQPAQSVDVGESMVDSALDAYMDAWDAHVQKVDRCETTWGDDQIEAARIGVRAALNRAIGNAQADGWSPMNTAPQDGTRVLLWAEGKCRVGYWVYFPADAKNPCAPTHWMPLPTPPTKATPDARE